MQQPPPNHLPANRRTAWLAWLPAPPAGLQQWLGSSLVPDGHGRFVWTFNVEGAAAMFDDYLTQDYSALLK